MTRNWHLGEPGWCWPDDVDKTGTEKRSASRYLPVLHTDKKNGAIREWEVARVFVDEEDVEMLEDAQLIVAAPKLLEACQLLIALEDGDVHDADTRWKDVRKLMRDAVALAREETNAAN